MNVTLETFLQQINISDQLIYNKCCVYIKHSVLLSIVELASERNVKLVKWNDAESTLYYQGWTLTFVA